MSAQVYRVKPNPIYADGMRVLDLLPGDLVRIDEDRSTPDHQGDVQVSRLAPDGTTVSEYLAWIRFDSLEPVDDVEPSPARRLEDSATVTLADIRTVLEAVGWDETSVASLIARVYFVAAARVASGA